MNTVIEEESDERQTDRRTEWELSTSTSFSRLIGGGIWSGAGGVSGDLTHAHRL